MKREEKPKIPHPGGLENIGQNVNEEKELSAQKSEEFRAKNRALRDRAAKDARAIIEMIIRDYNPERIYQWGSLLTEDGFRDYSDIDIAVEGITDMAVLSELEGKAYRMTQFPVDLVAIEKANPQQAESIRKKGRLVYKRP